jgi:hypothetical protein
MKRGSRASPVIDIAWPACGALPHERCASQFRPSGRPRLRASGDR